MIYSVNGTLIHTEPGFAVVECSGIGFKCKTTNNTLTKLPKVGEKVKMFTYLSVREDALDLFGFCDEKELACFKLLITVSGVGPKAALSVLSEMTPEKLAFYIASGDAKSIQKVRGVGTKMAQKIVIELTDKVTNEEISSGIAQDVPYTASGNAEEAVNALAVLGYTKGEASMAVAKVDSSLSVEDIIKQSLKLLAKN